MIFLNHTLNSIAFLNNGFVDVSLHGFIFVQLFYLPYNAICGLFTITHSPVHMPFPPL